MNYVFWYLSNNTNNPQWQTYGTKFHSHLFCSENYIYNPTLSSQISNTKHYVLWFQNLLCDLWPWHFPEAPMNLDKITEIELRWKTSTNRAHQSLPAILSFTTTAVLWAITSQYRHPALDQVPYVILGIKTQHGSTRREKQVSGLTHTAALHLLRADLRQWRRLNAVTHSTFWNGCYFRVLDLMPKTHKATAHAQHGGIPPWQACSIQLFGTRTGHRHISF